MDQDNKSWGLHGILMAAMLIAIVVQSFVIFGMQKKLDSHADIEDGHSVTAGKHSISSQTNSLPSLADLMDENKDIFSWDMDGLDPFEEMQVMQDHMNQMFGNVFNRYRHKDDNGRFFDKHTYSPKIDLEDKSDHYLVTVDVPGIEDSRLDIKVEGQKLTISGSSQSESKEEKKGKILKHERRSGTFQRSVTLPGSVQSDKMIMTNKAGVVYITIPKAKE